MGEAFSTANFTKEINGLKIDPQIFTFKFSCRCSGECCNYGVYTDLKEHQKIIEIKDKIFRCWMKLKPMI
jgi:hypothetical protein